MSTHSARGARDGKASRITASTMGPASSIEMTMPASRTASPSAATAWAPASANAAALA